MQYFLQDATLKTAEMKILGSVKSRCFHILNPLIHLSLTSFKTTVTHLLNPIYLYLLSGLKHTGEQLDEGKSDQITHGRRGPTGSSLLQNITHHSSHSLRVSRHWKGQGGPYIHVHIQRERERETVGGRERVCAHLCAIFHSISHRRWIYFIMFKAQLSEWCSCIPRII